MSDTPRTDALLIDGKVQGPGAYRMVCFAQQLERELNATLIAAGVASKERGEWEAEREDLRAALKALVRINEEDYAPWRIEPDSELGLAMAGARKALTTWGTTECRECPSGDCSDCPRKPARWNP